MSTDTWSPRRLRDDEISKTRKRVQRISKRTGYKIWLLLAIVIFPLFFVAEVIINAFIYAFNNLQITWASLDMMTNAWNLATKKLDDVKAS